MSQFLDKIKNLHKVAEAGNAAKSSSTEGAKAEETFVNSTFDSTQTQTQKSNSSSSAQNVHYAEMVDTNIFASSSEAGATLDAESIFSDYESKLNDMLNKTMKRTTAAMTFSTIASGLSTAGDLLLNFSSKKDTSNFVSSILGGSSAASQSAVSPLSTELGLSNDLSSAIVNYSNKGTSENWTSLVNQIALAKNDKNTLKTYMDEQQQFIKDYPAKEAALKQEIEEAKQDKLEKGKAVEAVREGIQAATRKNTIEKTEIPAQETIIRESQGRVESAGKTYTNEITAAENLINSNKTFNDYRTSGNTPHEEKYQSGTDSNGQPVYQTKWEPCTQSEYNTGIANYDKGVKDKKAAEEKYEKVLLAEVGSKEQGAEPTENSIQGKAKAKIKELEAEVEAKQKIIDESGQTQADLEKTQKDYMDAIDKLNVKNDELAKLKEDKTTAQLRYNQAHSQDKALDKQIAEAEKLMSAKK